MDLVTGLPFLQIEEGGIGSGPGRISMQRIYSEGAGFVDNWTGGLYPVTASGVTKMYVQFGGVSDTFSGSGTTWTSDKAEGATLTANGDGTWTYTAGDGTQVSFSAAGDKTWNCPGANPTSCQVPLSITRPDGLKFTLTWDVVDNNFGTFVRRLSSVTSSAGYSVSFTYVSNTLGPSWHKRASATFDNSASHPSPLPTIAYARPDGNTVTVTDPASRTWTFTTDASSRLTGVKRPGSASNNISYAYGADGTVNSATKDGVTNTYGRSVVSSTATETVTEPGPSNTVVISDLTKGRPTSYDDPVHPPTTYLYDANSRLTKITAPEGNNVQYGYDARGNVTTTTNVAKSGSGLANIVTSASFDATCANIVKCNKPNSTTDAKGYVTDYLYDATHGGVTSIKQPAVGGVRPETRHSYTQVTSASTDLVYMLTRVAACQTLASCTNGADETQIVAGYNSNLLPTSITRQDGTATLVATSTLTYDPRGNRLTVDGPLAGTADTTRFAYDSADQLTQVTSPDPDGAGSLPSRAIKLTYRPDGQASKQELGTAASDGSGFVAAQTVDVTFDTNSRVATRKLSSGGTAFALTQYSYDALGRLDCTAVRMNTAVYASLPASACTLSTQGSFGPDRIGQTVYDAADEVTQLKVGVGTTDAATERTLTYSNNGRAQTLKDGENNLTTYVYDGFDRLAKTQYPNTTKGSGTSSTTDYEQLLNYDANSNVGQRRLRDGTLINFSYDNLDRVTGKDLPGTEPDVTYGYDNLGRLTSASQSGNALAFAYDALSRKLTETGPNGTSSLSYDSADRLTQIIYPAGGSALRVTYTYLTTGELSGILQAGVTSLAAYAYDNLGNRTSATFENGAVQGFTYDPASRLASLTNDLGGTANDLTATFAYNPANQIASTVRTGDAYAFTALGSGTTSTTSNGLNQQVSIGGASATWDTKGNLHFDPTSAKSYCYSSENLLTGSGTTCSPPTTTLAYDPLLRLSQVASGGATTRFAYDGLNPVAENDASGAVLRRFVFDPTTGQPVIEYAGSGVGSNFHHYYGADERGSIVSVTDVTGALIAINTYDEYGRPGAGNTGRFQYTGQRWLSEIGAYDYKARVYLPHLGIFTQTDPIGQMGGANLYAYVGNDPLNFVDPLGLQETKPPEIIVTACQNGGTFIATDSVGGGFCYSPFALFDRFALGRELVEQGRDVLRDFADRLGQGLRSSICSIPSSVRTVSVGAGADLYAGAGGSLGAGFNWDIAKGRFGISGYSAVGLGFGADVGPNIGVGPSGGGMVSGNLAVSGGFAAPVVPGVNLGGSGSYNVLGTDQGFSGGGVGRFGTPLLYGNVGANIGFSTPSVYDLHCD